MRYMHGTKRKRIDDKEVIRSAEKILDDFDNEVRKTWVAEKERCERENDAVALMMMGDADFSLLNDNCLIMA